MILLANIDRLLAFKWDKSVHVGTYLCKDIIDYHRNWKSIRDDAVMLSLRYKRSIRYNVQLQHSKKIKFMRKYISYDYALRVEKYEFSKGR